MLIGGIVLGLIVTIIADHVIGVSLHSTAGPIIGYTVVLPIIQLIVMPLPALLLRTRRQFNETIDGLVCGVTAGLGFGLAEALVNYSNVSANQGVQTDSASWISPMVTVSFPGSGGWSGRSRTADRSRCRRAHRHWCWSRSTSPRGS